jgi:hypothetical protein
VTRLSQPVDLTEWMARIEERLRTVEGRVNQVPRPVAPAGTALFGPNILPNPTFEAGTAGWLAPSNATLTEEAIQGTRSLKLQHTSTQQTQRTKVSFEAESLGVRSYDAAGNPLPDVASWGYQGDYGSPFGLRSSLAWVNVEKMAGAVGIPTVDVETLEVGIDWSHWWQSHGGTAVIGLNSVPVVPPTTAQRPASGWDDDVFRVTWEGRYIFKWVNLKNRAAFLNAFVAGTLNGIMLGPGPAGQPNFYGYSHPNTKIRGSYWRTEVISSNLLQSTVWSQFLPISGSTTWQVSWLVNSSVPGVAHIGAGWAVNNTDAPVVVSAASLAISPEVTTRVTGVMSAPGNARFLAPYVTVVGDPPTSTNPDGTPGPRVPWSFRVDDATLRQKVGGA